MSFGEAAEVLREMDGKKAIMERELKEAEEKRKKAEKEEAERAKKE